MLRRKPERANQEGADDGDNAGWSQPPDPTLVKAGHGEAAAFDIGQHDARDQITRDHEENVDAHEAAAKRRHLEVIQKHAEHGDRAQAVDVRTVRKSRTHAITVAIDQYAEKALGNRDYFLNKPYGVG